MKDKLNRNIDYLRLSITDRCNLRCKYCMGNKDIVFLPKDELLSSNEIERLVKIFSELGIKKLRITGGEPLVRRNFREIVENINNISGIEEINITTNGIRLEEELEFLSNKKIQSLNISLDTLKADLYRDITGGGDINKVLNSIHKAIALKFKRIKLNVVLVKGKNDSEIMDFVNLTEKYPIDVRFIELMPIGLGKEFLPISNDEVLSLISKERSLTPFNKRIGSGPAKYYKTEKGIGCIGFITPISHNFCEQCNRIRVTPEGFLKLCLHWSSGLNLKELLRNGSSNEEIKKKILQALENKPDKHNMEKKEEDKNFDKRYMNRIGG
ncbi:GTP 3',8-cyclase MoaA [Fusobacterium mortiferum]|uniref:GTP 3',8-cyclase MoaA n=1 Tax=Fusobacterium mortiferum TaxID=850 RepID=UPI00195CD660|nr:GTP 3',8-cyclase MoaA [Fusobacterium mortiferum]